MICPYVKNRLVEIETTRLGVKETTVIKNTESFPRCIGGECPYYIFNPHKFDEYCLKVKKEMTMVIDSKGEIK